MNALRSGAKWSLHSWGATGQGRLGLGGIDGRSEAEESPVVVSALGGKEIIQVVADSRHSLAVTAQGEVYAWGSASSGRLGFEDTSDMPKDTAGDPYQAKPRLVEALKGKVMVQCAAADSYSFAVTSDGELYSWGCGMRGRLGYGEVTDMYKDSNGECYQPVPRLVAGLRGVKVTQADAGDMHTLVVTSLGEVFTWGSASHGRLGYGPDKSMPLDHRHRLPYQPTPRRVEALADVKIVQGSVGDWHSLVVSSEGRVYTWGSAEYGRLGYADTSHLPVDDQKVPYQTCPTLLNTLQTERVKQVAAGDWHSLALTEKGRVYTWGGASYGRLGHADLSDMPLDADEDPYQPTPRVVEDLYGINVVQVAAGVIHSSAVTEEGRLFTWGGASHGRLGLGDCSAMPRDDDNDPFQATPRLVEGLQAMKVVLVAAGVNHQVTVAVHVDVSLSLTSDLLTLVDNPESFPDLTIELENGDTVLAHRGILCGRSAFFAAMLRSQMVEGSGARVKLSDVTKPTLLLLVRWWYAGLDELQAITNVESILDLLLQANKFLVPEVRENCVRALMRVIALDTAMDIFDVAGTIGREAEPLAAAAMGFMLDHLDEVRKTPVFEHRMQTDPDFSLRILEEISPLVQQHRTKRRRLQ